MDIVSGTKTCPISFDHESEDHASTWPDTYRDLRATCPIAWTDAHGGYWVATRYKDVVAIAQNGEDFSSVKSFDAETMSATGGITIPATPTYSGLPVEVDRPEWDAYRGFINRRFAPKAAEARREKIRDYATALVDRVIETGRMDLVYDLTSPLPAITTMDLMGLPLDEWEAFAEPLHHMVSTPKEAPEFPEIIARVLRIWDRCAEEFEKAKAQPQNDGLLSYFAHEKIDGRYLTVDEVLGYCNNIISGGVDTTTALTSHALAYLHDHPEERDRLAGDLSLLPIAREEFIRVVTPIHGLARNARHTVEVNGVTVEEGDRVLLAWSAANRDPEIFDDPDTVDLSRYPNRHVSFGAGMHRCIGSFMARVMFEEMMTQVLTRLPDYRIDYTTARRNRSIGVINGWVNMPATFTPGVRSGQDLAL